MIQNDQVVNKLIIILLVFSIGLFSTGGGYALGGEIDLSFKDIIQRAAFDKRYDLRKSAGEVLSHYRTSEFEERIQTVIDSLVNKLLEHI